MDFNLNNFKSKSFAWKEINRTFLIEDEYDKYTSVGNLGLTITNFGILGNGWNKMEDGTINPFIVIISKIPKIIREQIEHFSYCGLWIGGIVNGQRRVSTAIVDGVFESGSEGFELFSNSLQFRLSLPSRQLLKIQWQSIIHQMRFLTRT